MKTMAVLCSLFILLLAGCAPKTVPPAPAPAAPTAAVAAAPAVPSAAPVKAAWGEEWASLVAAAKKEGTVVVYGTQSGSALRAVSQAFIQKFGVRFELISARGAELGGKIVAERRAGLFLADVLISGTNTFVNTTKPAGVPDPLEPALILPEVVDPTLWYGGGLRWVDAERKMVMSFAYPNTNVGVNTELVKPGEIKSFRDLLNPKWKGKILMNDPSVTGTGLKSFAVLGFHIMGLDFWREVAKQEPMIIRDQRLQVEWLAHGKYAILIFPNTPPMTEFVRAGAPLAFVMPAEGTYLSAGSGNVVLVNRVPHPNAARLFINWILSKEGQAPFSRAFGVQSARLDVPTEGIDPDKIRKPGEKYFLGADTEEWLLRDPEFIKAAREIFGHLIR